MNTPKNKGNYEDAYNYIAKLCVYLIPGIQLKSTVCFSEFPKNDFTNDIIKKKY